MSVRLRHKHGFWSQRPEVTYNLIVTNVFLPQGVADGSFSIVFIHGKLPFLNLFQRRF